MHLPELSSPLGYLRSSDMKVSNAIKENSAPKYKIYKKKTTSYLIYSMSRTVVVRKLYFLLIIDILLRYLCFHFPLPQTGNENGKKQIKQKARYNQTVWV